MTFRVFSSAFSEGGWIPPLHSCRGADVSPSLEWAGVPTGTRSFALLVDDPDAPMGTWTHWLLYDVPSTVRVLAQGSHGVGLSGKNSFGRAGYGGPCPPPGDPHRYYFTLYALDVDTLGLSAGASRAEFTGAIAGHAIAEARCMGRFKT
jgi:Raf kinase inhibitor-like YbhB/YbcL family protein